MNKILLLAWTLVGTVVAPTQPATAAENATDRPFLHPLFADNMVLQRDLRAPIWGWTEPNKKVTVRLHDKSAVAVADAAGKWMAKLGPLPAGGPHTLTVTGPQTVTRTNVLVGDVWLCSGQSNMQWPVVSANNAPEEIANANHAPIRLLTVPNVIAAEPRPTVKASWEVCSPTTVGQFSAVGYFFGRHLQQDLKVPIGLIDSSWGGTIAEAWASADALKTLPDFRAALDQVGQKVVLQNNGVGRPSAQTTAWWTKNDPGSSPGSGWADPVLDASGWKTMDLPQSWEAAGLPQFDGVVWFRKTIEIPAAWAGKDLRLRLGPIDDADTTYFNGTVVGAMSRADAPRDYTIPGNLVQAGRAVLAVRVLDTGGGGGLNGTPPAMTLQTAGDTQAGGLLLAGPWLYKDSTPLAKSGPAPQPARTNPNIPTVLYNAMIAPLVPYGIKGAIWYQGESNAGRAEQYRTLLPTLIRDWRSQFGMGDFPFLIVQLANFMPADTQPKNDAWPNLREAQLLTAQSVPKTGLAVAIDIGVAGDIHPRNKQEVGRRLALSALAIAYGKKLDHSGPVYRAMKIENNKIRLSFDHVGGGLVAKNTTGDKKLQGFAIAGADNNFVWADAVIENDTVVVSAATVIEPVAVRYAWSNNPAAELYNAAGLPASPFRTDK